MQDKPKTIPVAALEQAVATLETAFADRHRLCDMAAVIAAPMLPTALLEVSGCPKELVQEAISQTATAAIMLATDIIKQVDYLCEAKAIKAKKASE